MEKTLLHLVDAVRRYGERSYKVEETDSGPFMPSRGAKNMMMFKLYKQSNNQALVLLEISGDSI